jgi:hypothetical protein
MITKDKSPPKNTGITSQRWWPFKQTLNSESDFIVDGRKDEAFQTEQNPKDRKVHGWFGSPVSQPVQFKHTGLRGDKAGQVC